MLGLAQTLAWASCYYLPALLATPIARDLGISRPTVFAVFSMALLVSAFVGPWAGRRIDRHGGRWVLMGATLLFALGLMGLSQVQSLPALVLVWVVLGVAMGCGLYDAAFATLVALYGAGSRQAITGITLIAGFASTVGWPLTSLLEAQWGWRGACMVWAALQLLVALPLYAWLPRVAPVAQATHTVASGQAVPAAVPAAPHRATAPLLALMLAMMSFVSAAMAAHLPALLQACGASLATAVLAGTLLGPAQVAARLFELGVLRRVSPMVSAQIATCSHPLGAVLLWAVGAPVALLFVVLHGAGNGLLTIVRGTLPLALFGAQGYGARLSWISLPGRVLGALSPWLFGLALEHWGGASLALSSLLCLCAWGCVLALRGLSPRAAVAPASAAL